MEKPPPLFIKRLTKEFGKGFSVANVWNFRQFYLIFPENEILYALRRELTWTHYRSIMRVDNPDARKYYLEEASNLRAGKVCHSGIFDSGRPRERYKNYIR